MGGFRESIEKRGGEGWFGEERSRQKKEVINLGGWSGDQQ